MKKPLRVWMLGLLAMAALCGPLSAHQDTHIEVKEGSLVGLPPQYLPATFDPKIFRLRIGKHATTIHPYLQSFFDLPHTLRVTASWYHQSATPRYIVFHINPEGRDFGYNLTFNLDTLDLIDHSVTIQETASTSVNLTLDLTPEGKAEINKAVETLK